MNFHGWQRSTDGRYYHKEIFGYRLYIGKRVVHLEKREASKRRRRGVWRKLETYEMPEFQDELEDLVLIITARFHEKISGVRKSCNIGAYHKFSQRFHTLNYPNTDMRGKGKIRKNKVKSSRKNQWGW